MIAFADFQCPFCGQFARDVLPQLEKDYVETGQVQLVYRHLPLPNHPRALPAAHAAECAGRQGRFWQMHDRLFAEDAQLDDPGIRTMAGSVGMNLDDFEGCLAELTTAAVVLRDVEDARVLGLSATPSFLVGSRLATGDIKVIKAFSGARPIDEFRTELNRVMEPGLRNWLGALF